MASMNKPAYAATQVHAPTKPVLVFVASRRQTRLTALDLISYAAADERPEQWLHMTPDELQVRVCVWRVVCVCVGGGRTQTQRKRRARARALLLLFRPHPHTLKARIKTK